MRDVRITEAISFAWNILQWNSNLVIAIIACDLVVYFMIRFVLQKAYTLFSSPSFAVIQIVYLGIALFLLVLMSLYLLLLKYKLVKLAYVTKDAFSFNDLTNDNFSASDLKKDSFSFGDIKKDAILFSDIKKISWIEYKRFALYAFGLTIFVIAGLVAFIIPGVILFFAYLLVAFIAVDHPTWKFRDVYDYSRKITKGIALSLFLLFLVLNLFSAGLGTLPWIGAVLSIIFNCSFADYARLFVFFDLLQQEQKLNPQSS